MNTRQAQNEGAAISAYEWRSRFRRLGRTQIRGPSIWDLCSGWRRGSQAQQRLMRLGCIHRGLPPYWLSQRPAYIATVRRFIRQRRMHLKTATASLRVLSRTGNVGCGVEICRLFQQYRLFVKQRWQRNYEALACPKFGVLLASQRAFSAINRTMWLGWPGAHSASASVSS